MTCVICDKCRKPIPYVKKKSILGIEYDVLDRGIVRSSEWHIDTVFHEYDLCKSCAENISLQADNIFLSIKLAVLSDVKKDG